MNASGLTKITRQNVDVEFGGRGKGQRTVDALVPAPSGLQPSSLLSAAGQPRLGPYNSPMDEAYYYYFRRDPLDIDLDQPSGYVPSVPSGQSKYGAAKREDEHKATRVTFGPAATPRQKGESALVSVAAIPTLTESDQKDIAKQKINSYQAELQRQIEENKQRKNVEEQQRRREDAKLEAEIAGYNPFGKGGGGAPLKYTEVNVMADLKRLNSAKVDETPRVPPPTSVPIDDIPRSVYDSYVSPRQQYSTPRKTNALEEPTFARGGHGIFGNPKTDAEKSAADKYKIELQRQIEEKKRREDERKAQQKLEEERELKK